MPNEVVTVDDLRPLERNPRKRTDRGRSMLADSLAEHGAARSIVVDEQNTILAGNGTAEAFRAAHPAGRVEVVETDGETLIAVRRAGLSAAQKRKLAIADNRTAELAEWDTDVLSEEDPEMLAAFWDDRELQKLTGGEDEALPDADPQMGGIEYRVIVDCRNESEQATLLAEFEQRGLTCRALMT